MTVRRIVDDDGLGPVLYATTADADEWATHAVQGAGQHPGGRTNWVWLRLPNGDVALATFPQGALRTMLQRTIEHAFEEDDPL